MNNQFGCRNAGFVPANDNWDFNMDGECRRQAARNACANAAKDCVGPVRAEVCTGCGYPLSACTCGRRNCETRVAEPVCRRELREAVCTACGRKREACTCGQQACDAASACPEEREAPACVMKNVKPGCGGAQKGVGMVRVTKQILGDIFDNGRALKAGTLFPELHKPMNGYWPCDNVCGDDCQQAAFAAWELRLYLNTHPCDKQALALLTQIAGDCCEPNYATTFLLKECTRWAWTDDPWPWEYEFNANHGGRRK